MTHLALAGAWTLCDAAGAALADCPIPGDVHSALIAAGRIPDPMIGTNEADVQWVAETEWELRRTFDGGADTIAGRWAVLDLVFVDTIAAVTVNGTPVGNLDSCFVRHRLDLTDVLKPGANDIRIRFASTIEEASGAFEDASFALLPGETRTVTFRSFDGRVPTAADLTVAHLAETWR